MLNRRDLGGRAMAMALAPPTLPWVPGKAAPGAGPGPINGHSACLDSRRGAVLVFGGADASSVRGDLWRLSAGRWTVAPGPGPAPRTFAAMAYDARRDVIVLFGGNRFLFGPGGDTLLDDHWEWDGRSWTRLEGERPPSRSEAACAYDAVRGVTVLFGGYRFENGVRIRLDDLWEFDGRAWSRRSGAGPEARSGAALAFDARSGRCLLIGGNSGKRDVWALDAAGWSRLPDLPAPRYNAAAWSDPATGRTVVFGGWNGSVRIADTLLFDGLTWRGREGPQPPARNHAVLVGAPGGDGAILIGGHTGDHVLGDVWCWSDEKWRVITAMEPVPRVDNGH